MKRTMIGLVMVVGLSCDTGLFTDAQAGPTKSSAEVRATRRAYDGAPPVVPHPSFGADCVSCHNETGIEVAAVGFAPPSPHEQTRGMSAMSRCAQCHVRSTDTSVFAKNEFVGLPQDMRHGTRLYSHAPPTMPHAVFMRENCAGCHSGPAAREGIRCTHPERPRCQQCHVPVVENALFSRSQPE